MDIFNTFDQAWQRKNLFFFYHGPISHDILVNICNTIKQKALLEGEPQTRALRLFSVLVELTQNILFHGSSISHDQLQIKHGFITVGYNEKLYQIVCGNILEKHEIENLNYMLNRLQYMSKEEIKREYRETRKKDLKKVGYSSAGLGLLEIARIAYQPIDYKIQSINDKHAFISIQIMI